MRSASHTFTLALALVFSAGAVAAEEPAAPPAVWRLVDAETGTASTLEALRALAEAYPDSASVHRRLLAAQMQAGEAGAPASARVIVERGFAFSAGGIGAISLTLTEAEAGAIKAINDRNRAPVMASTLVDTIPAEVLLVESVVRDPASGTLFASSVVSRQLMAKAEGCAWQAVQLGEAGSLAGMAADPARGWVWAASGTFEETPGAPAYAAALAIDPAGGAIVRRLYANGMVPLGDLAVGDDGRVFAANPLAGEIHYADPQTEQGFRALVGKGVFRSPQGMVKVPGRNRLIVSDYSYGLAVVDWDSGKVWRIGSPGTHWLDGIDALLRYGDNMIAIQNGHQPMRILKLDMREDWLSIEKVTVLESNHPDWTEPVGASIDGDRVLYVATGQWDVFGKGGEVREGKQPRATAIRALPLPAK